jgi:apolipoprotein N-acyltransferase
MRTSFLFAILTGFSLSFAYPPFNLGFLAYWGLIPFFYLLERKVTLGAAFRWGYLTGFFIVIGGANALALDNIVGLLFACLLCPLYYALYAALHVFARQKLGPRFVVLIPFLWVGIEILKGLNQFGFGDLALGFTHPQHLMLFSESSHWSVFLVSFWICCLNTMIYVTLNSLGHRRKIAYLLVATVLMMILPLSCGYRSIEIPDAFDQFVESHPTICSS